MNTMNIDIPHIANLAALRVEDSELPRLRQEMEEILSMVQHLPELTAELPPDPQNVMELRADLVRESGLTQTELLQNAPAVHSGCPIVPQTVQESGS